MSPNPRGRPEGLGKPANLWELTQAIKNLAVKREPRHYPTKPKGIIQGPSAKTQASLAQFAELFATRDANGKPLTLEQIGQRVGVTREYVRQIRKRYFPQLGTIKADRASYIRQRVATSRFHSPVLFRRMVRGWLATCGYFQCCHCHLVKCIATDRTKMGSDARAIRSARCKWCTADGTWRWFQTPHGKQSQKAWVQANRDKVREYTRRSEEKKRKRKSQ